MAKTKTERAFEDLLNYAAEYRKYTKLRSEGMFSLMKAFPFSPSGQRGVTFIHDEQEPLAMEPYPEVAESLAYSLTPGQLD